MELKQIILYYLCVCTVACFPSKPLNDRPSELAWQAWLLVDSQNHPSETDRRITPKSVFIAPNIGDNGDSNGSLPECADGYRSDPMGRCIKFVKVDEAAHLDFLLQRLNAMYATKPSQDLDDETKPTSGPLQVNIPLGGQDSVPDPEIAIIVAPTNGNFDLEDEEKQIKFDKRTQIDKDDTEPITTTMKEEPTTTTESTTPSDDLQALFFLVPMNKTNHVVINRTAGDILKQADTPMQTTATETQQAYTEPNADNSTPGDGDMEPPAIQVKGKTEPETIKFTEEDTAAAEPFPSDLFAASLVRFPTLTDEAEQIDTSSTVRFPIHPESLEASDPNFEYDERHKPVLSPELEPHKLSSSEIEHLFKEYISQKPGLAAVTSTDRHVNRRRPIAESTYFDGDEIVTQPQVQKQHDFAPVYNHRNRDKSDFWHPSPTWREEALQKPLVLRFNRNPYQTDSENVRYYEERPSEEFSNAYVGKRRRGNLR